MKFTAGQIVLLSSILLIGFFSVGGYQMYLDNQPETNITQVEMPAADVVEEVWTKLLTNDSLVRSLYEKLPKFDSSVIVPIYYKYKDVGVVPNGNTTYWFFMGYSYDKDNNKVTHSASIELKSSYFDFMKAAEHLMGSNKKAKTCFITDFNQISQASYLSYSKYSKKY